TAARRGRHARATHTLGRAWSALAQASSLPGHQPVFSLPCPDRPRRLSRVPEGLKDAEVAQRVHRLPEAAMSERHQLVVGGQVFERLALEERVITINAVEDRRFEHEESPVHPSAVTQWLLLEGSDSWSDDASNGRVVLDLERPEAAKLL